MDDMKARADALALYLSELQDGNAWDSTVSLLCDQADLIRDLLAELTQTQAKAEKLAEALKGHETHMAQMQAFAVQYLTAKASRDNFIDAMIYRLDGPEQRAVQKSTRQALTEWSAK